MLKRYVPECPRALSDQFADEEVLARAVKAKKLGDFQLDQRTKGESDPAVAAASILARERFIDWMDECSRRLGFPLPRGATHVKKQAARLLAERGVEALPKAQFHAAATTLQTVALLSTYAHSLSRAKALLQRSLNR